MLPVHSRPAFSGADLEKSDPMSLNDSPKSICE